MELLQAAVRLDNGQYTAAPTGLTLQLGANPYDPTERLLTLGPDSLPELYLDEDSTPALFVRLWEQELEPGSDAQPSLLGGTGLSVQLAEGTLVPGEYWMIAVRPGTPQQLYPARYLEGPQLPDGPRQWICPLALIEWKDEQGVLLADCRPAFDNLVELTARVKQLEEDVEELKKRSSGCCTVRVSPTDAEQLQQIIDAQCDPRRAPPYTPLVVCFAPGEYVLSEPLRFHSIHSQLTLDGCTGATLSLQVQPEATASGELLDGMIVLEEGIMDVTIQGFSFSLPSVQFDTAGGRRGALSVEELGAGSTALGGVLSELKVGVGVRMVNSSHVTLQDCHFNFPFSEGPSFSAGIFANGTCTGITVRDNTFRCVPPGDLREWRPQGFGYVQAPSTTLNSAPATRDRQLSGDVLETRLEEASFQDNQFFNLTTAVMIGAKLGSVRFVGNKVRESNAGFWLEGPPPSTSTDRAAPRSEAVEALTSALRANPLSAVWGAVARGYPLPSQSQQHRGSRTADSQERAPSASAGRPAATPPEQEGSSATLLLQGNEVETGRGSSDSAGALLLWRVETVILASNQLSSHSTTQPTAALLDVRQCTTTGNMVINHSQDVDAAGRPIHRPSFMLTPHDTSTERLPARVAITGNVFLGGAMLPNRLDFPTLAWAALNTLVP